MSNVRAGDPFICAPCEAGAHGRCIGLACECEYALAPWLDPDRRQALRTGAEPVGAVETAYQATYRAHQDARRTADERRG